MIKTDTERWSGRFVLMLAQVAGMINNLFDRDPPLPANKNVYYDLLGRAFKVGMRFSFD